jgi:hypothetical protein
MKQDKNKIKEPYPPEKTPNPPQIIDPSKRNEQNENDQPVENKGDQSKSKSKEHQKQEKPKPKN